MSSWHSGKMQKISEKFPGKQTQMGQQLYLAGWGIGLASGAFLGGVFYSKMMFFVTGALLVIYILAKKIMTKTISPETCA